jgi:excinuclease UvrABC nuclease subunit
VLLREHADTYLVSTPSLARLSKKDIQVLQALIATAQDSYVQSTAQLSEENLMDQLLLEIQATYALTRIPLHMECIDISHL